MAHAKVDDTGGSALLAAAGVEVNLAGIAVGCNAQLRVEFI